MPGPHEVLQGAQEWAFKNLVPLNASLELTLRCNLRCTHCYNLDRELPHEPPELGLNEILRVMDDLRRMGCLFLHLTGGEVFLHPHLFGILDHARRLGLAVQILTNGTLVEADRLAGYSNLLGVSISLYGATAATHDAVTRVPGSFDAAWTGVRSLRARAIAVRLKFVILRPNAGEVTGMLAQAEREGLPHFADMTVTGRHDGACGGTDLRITPEEAETLYRGPLRHMVPSGEAKENDLACNCARGNCAITASGDVLPCISVPWKAGNLRETPFEEIWRDSEVFRKIRLLKTTDYKACAPCPLKPHCTREKGAAFIASGSYTGIDPWICAVAEAARRVTRE